MSIWSKNNSEESNDFMMQFTTGSDFLYDNTVFFKYDILASKAHVASLRSAGVLEIGETKVLIEALDQILWEWERGEVQVTIDDEDCHTTIENLIIERYEELGKKLHTGRSRNDQALTMIRLWMGDALDELIYECNKLSVLVSNCQERWRDELFIGYTHMRQAMPTTVGHYFNSYAEQIEDDVQFLEYVRKHINLNPLGTCAGYGTTVQVDRNLSSDILNFRGLLHNSLYAQNSRGKFESLFAHGLVQVMMTMQRLASDMLFFTSVECGFFDYNDSISTGSSVMPHKKNLDIAEIMRGNFGLVQGYANQIQTIYHGLISGYNRDTQLMKVPLVESFKVALNTTKAAIELIWNISPNETKIKEALDLSILSADQATIEAEESGRPFREIYQEIMSRGEIEGDPLEYVKRRKSVGAPGNY